jgi:hypothetical protein
MINTLVYTMDISNNRFSALKEDNNDTFNNKPPSIFAKQNTFRSFNSAFSSSNSSAFSSSNSPPNSPPKQNSRWANFKNDIEESNRQREEEREDMGKERENTFKNRERQHKRSFFRRVARVKTPPPKKFTLEAENFPALE